MMPWGEAGRWVLRIVLAAAAATTTWIGFLAAVDLVTTKSPAVQTEALRVLDAAFTEASFTPRRALNVVFFGDSLTMPENIANMPQSTPGRLFTRLGLALAATNHGDKRSIQITRIIYSGLSQWSLYYMASRMAGLLPDIAILEFNLYNFSAAWRHRDRTILSAFLETRRFPRALSLPLGSAGFATDAWLFHRALLLGGWLPLWEQVEHDQARSAEAYWLLSDKAGKIVDPPMFTMRELHRLLERQRQTIDSKVPGGGRATEMYARRLLGKTLTGVDESDEAMQMLAASLDVLAARGASIFVYIPPYNVEHLRNLGVLQGSRFEETIDVVRRVTESRGARFVDLHGIFRDESFRDNMDHLNEQAQTDNHDMVAEHLTGVVAGESRRILAGKR